ncbi:MAG: hypothetical protein AAB383_06360 [Patescibacteria group bacterium]
MSEKPNQTPESIEASTLKPEDALQQKIDSVDLKKWPNYAKLKNPGDFTDKKTLHYWLASRIKTSAVNSTATEVAPASDRQINYDTTSRGQQLETWDAALKNHTEWGRTLKEFIPEIETAHKELTHEVRELISELYNTEDPKEIARIFWGMETSQSIEVAPSYRNEGNSPLLGVGFEWGWDGETSDPSYLSLEPKGGFDMTLDDSEKGLAEHYQTRDIAFGLNFLMSLAHMRDNLQQKKADKMKKSLEHDKKESDAAAQKALDELN